MATEEYRTPAGTGKFGMLLMLAALAMLFVSGLLAYVIIRLTGRNAPPVGAIALPGTLWLSTVLILVSSVTVQHALACVRNEKQTHFRLSLSATLGLALGFVAVQVPSLLRLLAEHERLRHENMHLYGLIFMLILLHALHVVGGVVPLTVTWARALRGGYDHERFAAVTYISMYWHFLDAVWVTMFVVMLLLA
ncbi:MAG: heme-copper oxidase subunit III [Phycisphaeraceae bacterium]|nr:heme-copper oxidase subunit III [Phycisphaeraceae bacterium]